MMQTICVVTTLEDCLVQCSDLEIGNLLVLVQEGLCIFDPKMVLCEHAERRLLRSAGIGLREEYLNDEQLGGE